MHVSQFGAALVGAAMLLNWPTYGLDYANTRHAGIDQINPANVARLTPAWQYVLGQHEPVETTPIVVGGTMYVTTGTGNNVVALDAATGREKWRYRPTLGGFAACCGLINRGVAVAGNRVYLATLDARLIALDAATGKPVWDVAVGNPGYGFSETMAPLVWNGLVFIGSSGSDYGLRGSFSAYRAADGKLVWRWYSVSPGWQGGYVTSVHGISLHRDVAREKRDANLFRDAWRQGGGAVWMTPALDAKRGEVYFTTGNPWPVFRGSVRPGDNLYTDSIIALDARTGKLVWYYQETPHDVWEYEPSSPPVLFRARTARGNLVPVVAQAGKTSWLYIVDRDSGRLVRLSQPLAANANVYDDPPSDYPTHELPLRGSLGAMSYDPGRHFAFIASFDRPDPPGRNGHWREFLAAVNVDKGNVAWKTPLGMLHEGVRGDDLVAGSLSTDHLVFISDDDGHFYALNPDSGAVAWRYSLGVANRADANENLFVQLAHNVRDWLQPLKRWAFHEEPPASADAHVDSNPVAYTVNGREYIAVSFDARPERASGGAFVEAFALR